MGAYRLRGWGVGAMSLQTERVGVGAMSLQTERAGGWCHESTD